MDGRFVAAASHLVFLEETELFALLELAALAMRAALY